MIPPQNLAHRVMECIRAMRAVAAVSRQMPGPEPALMVPFRRRWNWFRTVYVGVPVLLLCSLLLLPRLHHPAVKPQPSPLPSGMAEEVARQIPEVLHWRLAKPGDFDSDAVAWLQQQGQPAEGSVRGVFAADAPEESAYVLKPISAPNGKEARLVILINGRVRFDATLPEVAIAARMPKDRISSIDWRGRAPIGAPDGDGILVIQRYQDPSSALVFFSSGVRLLTGHPRDFHTVSLQ